MMKANLKKFFFVVVLVCIGFIGGKVGKIWGNNVKNGLDENKVAFRVELDKKMIDYDLQASLDFLKCKYEKEGKRVYYSYAGDLYKDELNDAKINVFVRGYRPSFDKRLADGAYNVYFIHRFDNGYVEEFQNFDKYYTTLKTFNDVSNKNGIAMDLLEPITCWDKLEENINAKGIIYIHEKTNVGVLKFMNDLKNAKVFDSIDFNMLSNDEKINEFNNAKVVVFDGNWNNGWNKDEVMFAVYEILGYGKEVITNWSTGVDELASKGYKISGFKNHDELFNILETRYGSF